jgi:hypothetical protein
MFVEFQEISGGRAQAKPGTGGSLHTQEPVTVASFRTWRGWREYVARDRCLTSDFTIRIGTSPLVQSVVFQF